MAAPFFIENVWLGVYNTQYGAAIKGITYKGRFCFKLPCSRRCLDEDIRQIF